MEAPFPLRRKTTLIDLFFIICGLCKTLFNLGEKPEMLTNQSGGEASVGEGLADSQTLETQQAPPGRQVGWAGGGPGVSPAGGEAHADHT